MTISNQLRGVLAYGNQTDESVRLIRQAAYLENEEGIVVRNARKDHQNKLQGVSSTINMVTDGVKGAMSVGKAAENVGTAAQADASKPQMEQDFQAGRTGSDTEKADANVDLKNVSLGDGQTMGTRFNDQQRDVLMSGKVTQTKQELMDMGFTEKESKQLLAASNDKDGFTAKDAADFAWGNRKSESTVKSDHFQDTLIATLRDQPGKIVGEAVQASGKNGAVEDKKDKAADKAVRDSAEQLSTTFAQHQRTIGNTQLEALRSGLRSRIPQE